MSKVEKRNFRIKMHLACANDELRPIMSCVYFDNGYMVSTDAHMLVKARIDQFSSFEPEEIAILNGKLITKDVFKKIFSCKQIIITEDGLTDVQSKTVYKFAEVDGKYPNYQAVIPTDVGSVDSIGVNPRLARKLFDVLNIDGNNIVLSFHAKNRAIKIHSLSEHEDSLTAILMPVMMEN